MTISLATMLLSLAGMATILSRHVDEVRNGNGKSRHPSLLSIAAPHIERGRRIVDITHKHAKRGIYRALLILLGRFTPWFSRSVRKVESSLARIIQTIQGKGVVNSNGQASEFLKQVREHSEEVKKEKNTHLE